MQQKNINQKVFLMRFYISIIILLCIIIGIMGFSFHIGNRMITVYNPLIDATKEIKLEATTAHLWFEEIISGNRNENIDQVWEYINQAEWYTKAMLEGGENKKGIFIPLNNTSLSNNILEVKSEIEKFRRITHERYVAIESSQAGTDIDEKYDAVFRSFILQANEVEIELQQIMAEDLSMLKKVQMGSIFIVILIAIVLVAVFIYIERIRKKDYIAILKINLDLEKEIVQRKKAKDTLLENEDKYQNQIKSLPLPLRLVDTKGKLIYINDRFTKTFGYTAEDIPTLEEWWVKAYPDYEYRKWVLNNWNNTVEKAEANNTDIQSVAYEITCKDGSIRSIIVSALMLNTGFLATFTDITERKQVETAIKNLNEDLETSVKARTIELDSKAIKLEKSRRALTYLLEDVNEIKKELELSNSKLNVSNNELESFSYSVSHDLRAPLRHINGYIQLLTKRFPDVMPEKGIHYLNNISDSANQMGALIDDLLQFSRTSKQEMNLTNFEMNVLVQEVLETIKLDSGERKIEWLIPSLPITFGDYTLLKLVWYNLLNNAVKFTQRKEKAKIEIGFKEDTNEYVFFVKDNGAGFDMKYAAKLFGVFQRMHSAEEYEGTGIGLANVRRIIQRHDGRTWAEAEVEDLSEGKVGGATFYFTLKKAQ